MALFKHRYSPNQRKKFSKLIMSLRLWLVLAASRAGVVRVTIIRRGFEVIRFSIYPPKLSTLSGELETGVLLIPSPTEPPRTAKILDEIEVSHQTQKSAVNGQKALLIVYH